MKINNRNKHYCCPENILLCLDAEQIFADSGNITSDFFDGGNLPGWDEGNITSGFRDGGSLPNFD